MSSSIYSFSPPNKVPWGSTSGAWLRHSMDDTETGSLKVFKYGRYDGLLTGKLANKMISNRWRTQNYLGHINYPFQLKANAPELTLSN